LRVKQALAGDPGYGATALLMRIPEQPLWAIEFGFTQRA
jgi:hypothetical protein